MAMMVRCPCCGVTELPHEMSKRLCGWCYDECTDEGCLRPLHIVSPDDAPDQHPQRQS